MGTPQYGAPPPQYPQAPGYGTGGFGGYGRVALQPADVGKRIVAGVIDMAVVIGVNIVVMVLSFLLSAVRLGIVSFLLWPLAWAIGFLYKPYFEVTKNGQTPGKKMQNIRVVKDDGSPVDWGAAILRQLFMAIAIIELVVMMVQSDRKRLGDMVAKTSVVEASSAPVPSAQPAGYGQQPGYGVPQPQPGGYAPAQPQPPAAPQAPQPPQLQPQVPSGYPQPQPQPGQAQPAPGPAGPPPAPQPPGGQPQPPGGQPPPPGYPSG